MVVAKILFQILFHAVGDRIAAAVDADDQAWRMEGKRRKEEGQKRNRERERERER